jgi:hypothetical protein
LDRSELNSSAVSSGRARAGSGVGRELAELSTGTKNSLPRRRLIRRLADD